MDDVVRPVTLYDGSLGSLPQWGTGAGAAGVVQVACGYSSLGARRQAHASDAGDVGHTARLVALLFLSTCRNYKVSNERVHHIAIEAKLLEDVVSQMNCVKHRRYCDIVRRLR